MAVNFISLVLYAGELGAEGLDIESRFSREERVDCSNDDEPALPELCHHQVAFVQSG